MVFGSVGKAFSDMIKKPVVLLPMLIVTLAANILIFFTSWVLERPLTDIFLYYDSFAGADLLQVAIMNYPLEIATMILTGIVVAVITVVALLSIARVAKGAGFMEAVNDSIREWKKSLALVIFLLVVGIILFAVVNVVGYASALNEWLGLIAIIIFGIILLIAAVKLIFFIPALVKENPKEALKLSWEFTNDKFWKSLLLIIIILIVFFVVKYLLGELSALTDFVADDILMILSDTITMTFAGLAVSHYFYSK